MVFLSKMSKAARRREAVRRVAAQALLPSANNPAEVVLRPAQEPLEVALPQVPDWTPLEMTIAVTEELSKPEAYPFDPGHVEEVKLELLEEASVELPDPIESSIGIRCRFCWKLVQVDEDQEIITREMIDYVLGVDAWESHCDSPECCKECKTNFKLFYDFKKSCLVALSRQDLLLTNIDQEKYLNPVQTVQTHSASQTRFIESSSTQHSSNKPSHMELNADDGPDNQDAFDQHSSDEIDIPPSESSPMMKQSNHHKHRHKTKPKSRSQFRVEAIKTHNPKLLGSKSRKSVKCPQCPRVLKSQDDLDPHLNMHKGIKTVPCRRDDCTKMFFTIKARREHEFACGPDRQLICSICAAILCTSNGLRSHMANHGEPTFACEQCGKAFHLKYQLIRHSRVHSDARNYECKVCGKRFKSSYANRVHQRIHTQEKPYVCHICGMAYAYNCLLKTHLEKGHDEPGGGGV